MDRAARIREFFNFLKINRWDENTIDIMIGKLCAEIKLEQPSEKHVNANEYLESLLEIKNGPLADYLNFKDKTTKKEAILSFRKLMDLLIQSVRLYGMDTAL